MCYFDPANIHSFPFIMTCYVFIKTTPQPDVSMHNGDYCKRAPVSGQLGFLSEPKKNPKTTSSASVVADLRSLQVKFFDISFFFA